MPLMPLLWLLVWLGAVIMAGLLYGSWAAARKRRERQRRARDFRENLFRWGDRER